MVALASALLLAGCTTTDPAGDQGSGHEALIAEASEVAQGLDTPEEARAAGYEPDRFCIPGMGVHWIHQGGQPGSHVDTELDVEHPEVVLFEPADSDMNDTTGDRFLGVEYVVITEGTEMNSTQNLPTIMGVPVQGPMAGHTPGMPWHAEVHVYLADGIQSPEGFPPTMDSITCPEGTTPPAEHDHEDHEHSS